MKKDIPVAKKLGQGEAEDARTVPLLSVTVTFEIPNSSPGISSTNNENNYFCSPSSQQVYNLKYLQRHNRRAEQKERVKMPGRGHSCSQANWNWPEYAEVSSSA